MNLIKKLKSINYILRIKIKKIKSLKEFLLNPKKNTKLINILILK